MRNIQKISFLGLLLVGMGTQLFSQQPTRKNWQVGASLPIAMEGLKDWTNETMGLSLDAAYQMPLPGNKAFFRAGLGLNYFPGKAKGIPGFQDTGDDLIETWKNDTRTISLTGVQITGDLVIPLGSTNFSLLTGFSLNTWHKKVSGQFPHDWRGIAGSQGGWEGDWVWYWDPPEWVWEWEWIEPDPWYPIERLGRDNNFSGTVKNIFGKAGVRLGAEYAVNDKFTIAAMLQLTELGTDSEFLDRKFRVDYDISKNEVPDSENKISGKHRVNPAWLQVGVRYKF